MSNVLATTHLQLRVLGIGRPKAILLRSCQWIFMVSVLNPGWLRVKSCMFLCHWHFHLIGLTQERTTKWHSIKKNHTPWGPAWSARRAAVVTRPWPGRRPAPASAARVQTEPQICTQTHEVIQNCIHSEPQTGTPPQIFPKPSLCHHTKFGYNRISSSDDTAESHNLPVWSLHCDFDLEESKPVFSLQLMMMHHYTKSGNKRFSNSADTVWTNVYQHSIVSL